MDLSAIGGGAPAAFARIAAIRSRIASFEQRVGGIAGGYTPPSSSATAFASVLAQASGLDAGAVLGTDDPATAGLGAISATGTAPVAIAIDAVASDPTGTLLGDDVPAGTPYAELYAAAAQRYGLSARMLAAVGKTESGFRTDAVSAAGAQGIMQFMPSTAAAMGVDPWDPASAIDGAARLLRGHLDRFGRLDAALAAYNAGGGAVAATGGTVPASIRPYVDKVLGYARGGW